MESIRELPQCDVVMKGGITSGVVYPRLIARLAEKYRFRSIGGTSAGAIAAAACAAAELGRQSGRVPDAFARLAQLATELGRVMEGNRNSRLSQLFRPTAHLRAHHAVLLRALNQRSVVQTVRSGLAALLPRFWPLLVLGLLLTGLAAAALVAHLLPGPFANAALAAAALLLLWAAGVCIGGFIAGRTWSIPLRAFALVLLAAALPAASTAVLHAFGAILDARLALAVTGLTVVLPLGLLLSATLAVAQFGFSLLGGLQRNFWGLCSGHDPAVAGTDAAALTDWLHGYLNGLAGLDPEQPLRFGDLWGSDEKIRQIDLQMMTSAISQHTCFTLPFRPNAPQFWYDPDEWARLFPESVMRCLLAGEPASDNTPTVRNTAGAELRRLPDNRDLPVLVATRMSLSFPVLLSAIPLYALDASVRRPEGETAPLVATRVWFSDGGIASNMPLHFFDSPLPSRPTFTINLKSEHPSYPIDRSKPACAQEGRVYLPVSNSAGLSQHWPPPKDGSRFGLFAFLHDVIQTMQNWRDQIQFPYPGYRDRIVQISQLPDEGGLNLDMPAELIESLSDAGACAAEKLIERFHPESQADARGGWENHQEVRLRTFLALFEELTANPHVVSPHWDEVAGRLRESGRFSESQLELAVDLLSRLRETGDRVAAQDSTLVDGAPRPPPQLRIVPRI